MSDWTPSEYQQELAELVDMMAHTCPDKVGEDYVQSTKVNIREEPFIEFETLPTDIDEIFDEKPPAAIIAKVKRIALLMDMYVLEMDFWEAGENADPVDLLLKHFPSGWDKTKIAEATLELSTDPSIKEFPRYQGDSAMQEGHAESFMDGVYDGVHLRFSINPYTQKVRICYPLGENRRFTSFRTVQELYG